MSQISLPPEEEFRQLLLDRLPPVIARKDVERQIGGVVAMKTLANADASGKGPLGAYLVGRSVVYPAASLVDWIIERLGVNRLKGNLKELL
ncbi:MAG: hypothetical protein E7022_08165 [Desulfovibrio desulfuricans]|nr:hypothetical protein [Desulfovibrio desulfuricans]